MRQIYETIDRQGYQWIVVLVAGLGFFLDGYTVSDRLEKKNPNLQFSNNVSKAICYKYGPADDLLRLLER